jgi:hypothetical protein
MPEPFLKWQRPTSWSAESTDGRWYIERERPKRWYVELLRGRRTRPSARFTTLKAAKAFAEDWERSHA